jgi:hypothetical protein
MPLLQQNQQNQPRETATATNKESYVNEVLIIADELQDLP